MPTPATTGVLRDSLKTMKIGDYIPCHYAATSNTGGTFSRFGISGGTELTLNGTPSPSGVFYFVKVDTGLLIADRVVQNSITWITLNNAKYMQGFYEFCSNPAMTNNTTPIPFRASSSSQYGSAAYAAFNKLGGYPNAGWVSSSPPSIVAPQWLQIDLGVSILASSYAVTAENFANLGLPHHPRNWTFEGSNDSSHWDVLDTRSNITWSSNQKRFFYFNNKNEYQYYRLNITSNNGSSNYVVVAELEVFLDVMIRSLTGGVAYANSDGNRTQSDNNIAGWPTNNEWDRYIVNFPQNFIQLGKTIDDVFHWSSCYTFTQDTPVNGLTIETGNTYRIYRGHTTHGIESINVINSISGSSSVGFRPVLEYKEV